MTTYTDKLANPRDVAALSEMEYYNLYYAAELLYASVKPEDFPVGLYASTFITMHKLRKWVDCYSAMRIMAIQLRSNKYLIDMLRAQRSIGANTLRYR